MLLGLDRPRYGDLVEGINGLVVYAPCDDRSGSIVDTKLGSSRGAVTGTVRYGTRTATPRAATPSLEFTGVVGTAVSGTSTLLPSNGTDDWTIFAWVLMPTTVTANSSMLFGFGRANQLTGSKRYFIRFNSRVYFWGDNADVQGSVDYDIGRPQLIAATRNSSGVVTVYKNGISIGSATRTMVNTLQTWELARRPYFNTTVNLAAHIAHFGVVNRTMTANELRWLYQEGVA